MASARQPATARPLQPSSSGTGPLLQRDYWALLDGCELSPSQLMAKVAERFTELASSPMARFRHAEGCEPPLEVGDELDIRIPGAGACAVRVVHRDRDSFTLATLKGHPEAGCITFGSYRHRSGAPIFHVRSRGRTRDRSMYLGFIASGESMQTNTWTDLVNTVALTYGSGVRGQLHVETCELDHDGSDAGGADWPTFLARGD